MRIFGQRKISARERACIETEAWARFKEHIDFERMANELRDLRDQVEARDGLLWEIHRDPRPGSGYWREQIEALVGAPPVHVVTPIGVTLGGKFVEMEVERWPLAT